VSVEAALIAQARPQVISRRIGALIGEEITKGCLPQISDTPVGLEPPFRPLLWSTGGPDGALHEAGDWRPSSEPPIRLRVWVPAMRKTDWNRSELFLKQLASIPRRLGYEIVGNREGIAVMFLCQAEDVAVVETALCGVFDSCELERCDNCEWLTMLADGEVRFREYFPGPPYTHLLTRPEELEISPYGPLLQALSELPADAVGLYQCLFQGVRPEHDWHRNVATLLTLEFMQELQVTSSVYRQITQQTPSGYLPALAREKEFKAHNDKPFFAASARIAVAGQVNDPDMAIRKLSSYMGLFQHGGRPLNHVTETDYAARVPVRQQGGLFSLGHTHRPGHLVNSEELASLVHIFSPELLEERRLPLGTLNTLPIRSDTLREGTAIGICEYAGKGEFVCIPEEIRTRSTHIVGNHRTGKSTLMVHMFLQDIQEGRGAVFIDPHGDAIKDLLALMPDSAVSRCIHFDPGDPEWIPIWNPMKPGTGVSVARLADDLVSAVRRVCPDWGDRLEHVLRNAANGLLNMADTHLYDLYNLLRPKSNESELLRRRILNTTPEGPVKGFWAYDFHHDYRSPDLQAPKHKLSKLMRDRTSFLMLSQPDTRIDFREVMDEGMIMLVDLSSLGQEAQAVLGSIIMALFLVAAFSRSDLPIQQRRRFSVYADEGHRFSLADVIEQVVAQARKFGVDLCMGHQYLRQFNAAQVDALATVGTTIMGRVNEHDSRFFINQVGGQVKPEDLTGLEPFTMIARIGTEVVRFKTPAPPDTHDPEKAARIIAQSRAKYCVHVSEHTRSGSARNSISGRQRPAPNRAFTAEQLSYDEF